MLRLPGMCRGWPASQVGQGAGAAVCVGLTCWEVPCLPGPGTGRPVWSTCQRADLVVNITSFLGCQSAAGVWLLWAEIGDPCR